MRFEVQWTQGAHEDLSALFDHVAEQFSVWEADRLCERLLDATQHLQRYPRLYEAAPEWGEGVRRISLLGQHVLYEVNEAARSISVLAVVGQRQNPHRIA